MRFQVILSAVTLLATTANGMHSGGVAEVEARQEHNAGQAGQTMQDIEETKHTIIYMMGITIAEITLLIASGFLRRRDLDGADPSALLAELEQTAATLDGELDRFLEI
ncbi:hypothetical protein ACHAQH_009793, partial [Verticillium albo-atrum]